jgi:hypothetical protein
MATLTYDPTPADQPEFSEAEQEAIKIGEEAIAEQQQLLAGKFEDAQALEQAYIELQKKLGEPRDEVQASDEGQEEAPAEEEVGEEVEQTEDESPDLTPEDVEVLQNIVGGPEGYKSMMQWANDNLGKQEINMYNSVMDKGDPAACFFAVQALANLYGDAVGTEGQMLTGGPSKETADVFRSQAEVVKAMSDPRYDRDPAYRQDVFNKLERSNLNNY